VLAKAFSLGLLLQLGSEMCGRVRKLFARPRTDAEATVPDVADADGWTL